MRVIRELFTQIFSTSECNELKPFIDHTLSLTSIDNKILFRHYEHIPTDRSK
jgi:hypothetical protein